MICPCPCNRYRRSDIRVHSRDESDEKPTVLPVDLHPVRGYRRDDNRGPGHGDALAVCSCHVQRVVRDRFCRAVLHSSYANVVAIPGLGREGPPSRTMVRVRTAAH